MVADRIQKRSSVVAAAHTEGSGRPVWRREENIEESSDISLDSDGSNSGFDRFRIKGGLPMSTRICSAGLGSDVNVVVPDVGVPDIILPVFLFLCALAMITASFCWRMLAVPSPSSFGAR
jgi:hypothetical protein